MPSLEYTLSSDIHNEEELIAAFEKGGIKVDNIIYTTLQSLLGIDYLWVIAKDEIPGTASEEFIRIIDLANHYAFPVLS